MAMRIDEAIYNSVVGEVLAHLREQSRLRQVDVANALGVSIRTIMRLESGEVMLRPALQVELARLYGVASELITRFAVRRYEQRMKEFEELEKLMCSGESETDSLTRLKVSCSLWKPSTSSLRSVGSAPT